MADEQELGTGAFMTPLRAVGVQMNEIYEELKRAGFNKNEALYLVGQMLVETMQYGSVEIIEDENDESDDNDYDEDDLTT